MRLAYLYYLETYRSDAFLEALASHPDTKRLHVYDFTLLRKVFRHGDIDRRAQRDKHLNRLSKHVNKIRYNVCPAISVGRTGMAAKVSLALSVILALLWGAFIPFRLLACKINRLLFYNGHPLYLLTMLYARTRKLPWHTDLGDVLYLVDNRSRITQRLELTFLHGSQSIICVSKPFKNFLVDKFNLDAASVRVVSASIPKTFPVAFDEPRNIRRAAELRRELSASEGELILGYAGYRWFRYVKDKGVIDVQGVDGLCRAVEWLNDNGVPTRLVIIGAPPRDPGLLPFLEGRHGGKFHVPGRYKPLDERHCRVLGGVDFLCIPSAGSMIYQLYDRFKMYEYMAAGKIIVAADVSINHDVFGEHAIFFEDGNWQHMAEVIQQHRDRAVTFNATLNHRVAEHYTWEKRLADGVIPQALFAEEPVALY